MKAVLLVGPGSNQRALAHRLHGLQPLAHVLLVDIQPATEKREWVRSAVSITFARLIRNSWLAMMAHYETLYPSWPAPPSTTHLGANATSVIELIEAERPDLVLVSGTDLLRAPVIKAIQQYGKVINLHTGISPFIKGAPNCTNWALALGEFDLIGNTVMWLDQGIDSGAVIATERTSLKGTESPATLHIAVMDHAHDLFGRAYDRIMRGLPVPSVPQASLGDGRLFLNRHWNSAAMIRATTNFVLRYRPAAVEKPRPHTLVDMVTGPHIG